MKKIAATAIAAILAIPGLAMAGQPGMGECKDERRARRAQIDLNKDGQVDFTERLAAKKEHRQEKLAQFDTNRDGKLNKAERTRAKEARFARFDANGDGRITRAEVGTCNRLAKHFDRIDANGDGRITQVELASAKMHKGKRGDRPNWRKRHSSDG